MKSDPVIEELHRIRDEHSKQFNYDVHAICEDIRRREKESGRTYVSFDKSDQRATDSEAVVASPAAANN